MKTQLSKPARRKASYSEQYKQEALELWRASAGRGQLLKLATVFAKARWRRDISVATVGCTASA